MPGGIPANRWSLFPFREYSTAAAIAARLTAPEPISAGQDSPLRSIQLGGSTTIGASLLTAPALIPATMVICSPGARLAARKIPLPSLTVFTQSCVEPAVPWKHWVCCTPSGTVTLTSTCLSSASQADPVASQ